MKKSAIIAKVLDPKTTNLGSVGIALVNAARKEK